MSALSDLANKNSGPVGDGNKFTIDAALLKTSQPLVPSNNITPTVSQSSAPAQPTEGGSALTRLATSYYNKTLLPKAIPLVKDAARGSARSAASVGQEISQRLPNNTGDEFKTPDIPVLKQVSEFLFGKEPVPSFSKRVVEGEKVAQGLGIPSNKDAWKSPAFYASAGFIGATTALDFLPMNGEKTVAEELLKNTDTTIISGILKKIGVADDIISDYAKAFSKAKTIEEVTKGLDSLKALQESTHVSELSKLAREPGLGTAVAPAEGVFNAEKYVAEQTAKQEAAAKVSETGGILGKVKGFFADVKRKLVDFNAPIEDVLAKAQKEGGYTIPATEHITNQIDRVLRAPTIAGQFVRDNGLEEVIKTVDNLDNLDQYMIAKQAKAVAAQGFETGRDLLKDDELIKQFGPRYQSAARVVTDYSHKLLDYSVESGLISKDLAAKLKELYPDYVPINRIFNELEQTGGYGTKAVASLSTQTAVQGLKGSEREIQSPIKSLLEKTADVFKQGEKNKAAQMLASYEKLPGNPFNIVPLRTAENVTKRMELATQLGEKIAERNKVTVDIVRTNKTLRGLVSKINATDKELTSLAEQFGIISSDFGKPAELEALFQKGITQEERIAVLTGKKDITEAGRAELESVIADRKSLIAEIRTQLGDVRDLSKASDQGTITSFKNGIKEIHQVPKEIEEAAKALNVQQLNVLGKIFAFPVRLAKLGITGINLPFIAANVAKDQVTAFINSSEALRTSIGNPAVFTKSLFEAVGHGKVYEEMAREGALGTSFDIARNQVVDTVEKLRAGRTVAGKIKYLVTHPGDLLRAAEDIVGRSEELTRIQQYTGTKQGLLAKGASEAEARIGAARAARENTVNFARRGEWGQVLNSAFLYLNASIQGTRTFLRTAKEKPIQTAVKMALTVFTPVAATTAWNLSDPKRAAAYKDIPEYEKQNNIIIIPSNPTKNDDGTWNVIKIPLSQEINNIASMARRPIEQAYGLNPLSVKDITKALVGTVSPVAINSGGVGATIASNLPQAFKPSVEAYANKNFFTGIPQVPASLSKLSPELQTKSYTSGTARKIGGALGLSPIKVEEFIKGTFGGIASQYLNASDHVLAGLDIIPKDQIGGKNTIKAIVDRFAIARGGQTDNASNTILQDLIRNQADESFRLKQEAEILYADLKKLSPDEANAKAAEIEQSNPALFDKLSDVVDSANMGLTYNDRLIKQLSVTSGERAKFIWESLKAFKTPEEKNSYVSELQRKKLISDLVLQQLIDLKARNY